MTDLESKIRRQLAAILAGEATLLEQAHANSINVERVEEQIRRLITEKKVFGSDDIMDVIMAGYCIGRKDQAIASFVDLIGKEKVQELYHSVCVELGLEPKRLN
jgi:predicted nucleic acid-binding protein